jgi:hypothetical protein
MKYAKPEVVSQSGAVQAILGHDKTATPLIDTGSDPYVLTPSAYEADE